MNLNSSFRQTWFGIFTPAVYLLNTGTNDRNTLSADDFETKLRSYCNDVIIGSPNTKLIIVEPNHPADYNTSNAHLFTSRRIKVSNDLNLDYLDLPKAVGNYNYFVSNQMMLDGVHPNEKGVNAIAKAQLEYLGIQIVAPPVSVVHGIYDKVSLDEDSRQKCLELGRTVAKKRVT